MRLAVSFQPAPLVTGDGLTCFACTGEATDANGNPCPRCGGTGTDPNPD